MLFYFHQERTRIGYHGERIRFICNLRGMIQKWLDQAVGFEGESSDVRIPQYELVTENPES